MNGRAAPTSAGIHLRGRDAPGRAGTSPRTARARSSAPATPSRARPRRPRAPPARWRARCAGSLSGGGRGRRSWEASVRVAASGRGREAADAVQDEIDHVPLAPLEVRRPRRASTPDGGGDGARVDQRKPAERDDAEQELGRVARRRRRARAPARSPRAPPGRPRGGRRPSSAPCRRPAPPARSAGGSWDGRRGSRNSRRPRRRESPRESGRWRAPAPARRARLRGPRAKQRSSTARYRSALEPKKYPGVPRDTPAAGPLR